MDKRRVEFSVEERRALEKNTLHYVLNKYGIFPTGEIPLRWYILCNSKRFGIKENLDSLSNDELFLNISKYGWTFAYKDGIVWKIITDKLDKREKEITAFILMINYVSDKKRPFMIKELDINSHARYYPKALDKAKFDQYIIPKVRVFRERGYLGLQFKYFYTEQKFTKTLIWG